MIRPCKIDKALIELNRARGHADATCPGYLYYADIRGDGTRRPRTIWRVVNAHGGVTRSELNRRSPRATLAAIRQAIRFNHP